MIHIRSAIVLVLAGITLSMIPACAPVEGPSAEKAPTTTTQAVQTVVANKPLTPDPTQEPSDQPIDQVQQRIERAIDQVRHRDLATTNGFWTIFHGLLGLGPTLTLKVPETGWKVNALEFVCQGAPVRGMRFIPTRDGVDVESGETFVSQGHQDQFIAELAQWNMPPNRVFTVNGIDYTYMDFARHTKARASLRSRQELSWAILVIGQYFGTDISWTNKDGEKLSFEDLVRYELDQPMDNAACGGTHRLFDLAWVYYLHLNKGGKTEGVWKEIVDKTRHHHQLAKKYRNPDGSFSTDFFKGPENVSNKERRMNTTGHTLEWLALTLPDEELRAPWVQDAVNALTQIFFSIENETMESGSLYHATHGLLIYHARVYGTDKLGANAPYLPPLPPGWKQPAPNNYLYGATQEQLPTPSK
jgi:hypothetical protein